MRKPTFVQLCQALIIATLLFLLGRGVLTLHEKSAACQTRGGAYARTALGFACVKLERQ